MCGVHIVSYYEKQEGNVLQEPAAANQQKVHLGMFHILPYIRPPLDNLELNANIA